MKIDMNKWRESLRQGGVKAVPMMSRPGLQITGLKMSNVVSSGENQAACVEAVARRFPTAASVAMMDLSAEAEAFGAAVKYAEDDVPSVTGHVVDDISSAKALEIPKVGAARTGAFLKSAELLAQRITDRPVFGMTIGPFSLAADLMGISTTMLAVIKDPEMVHTICEKATVFLIEYASAFKDAGVNGLIVADMSAGLLSPRLSGAFVSDYFRKLVEAVQDDSFMIILHNCGKTTRQVGSMVATGAAGLHFGNAVKMNEIAAQIPAERLVLGNIDPSAAFLLSQPDEIGAVTRNLLNDMAAHPNFVLSSGCDVPADSPFANIDAFFAALESHNAVAENAGALV